MTAGQPVGTDNDRPGRAARRHRRGRRPRAVVAHGHVRLRRVAVRPRRVDRFGIAARKPGGARRPMPMFARRRDRSRAQRRRPRGAGVRERPARSRSTPSATSRASGAASSRCGGRSWASAARRAPTARRHAAQPHGVQGRHQQPRRRGHRRARRTTCGWAERTTPRGCAAGSYLVDPPHPHAARGLGPLHARRPGAHHRPRSRANGAPLGGAKEHDIVEPRRPRTTASP